jgi:hypothetical protein
MRLKQIIVLLSVMIICFAGQPLDASDLKQKDKTHGGEKVILKMMEVPSGQTSSQTSAAQTSASQTSTSQTSTSSPKSKMLFGRIEELTLDAVSPPVAGKLNASISAKTYPQSFLGTWGGKIVIDQNDYGVLKTLDPRMWMRESHILFPGREGVGEVTFIQSGDLIEAEPPRVQFKPTEADMQYLDLLHRDLGPHLHFNVVFGAKHGTTITGNTASSQITINKITSFPHEQYEQQIATSDQIVDVVKHTISFGTTEVVTDFHELSPQEMQVSMALVKYARNGAMESKMIMHGTLVKRQPADSAPHPMQH